MYAKKVSHQWTGRWFYSLFNVLFLMGYHPETSYENRHHENWIVPDEEYVAFIMEHMLQPDEMTKDNEVDENQVKSILSFLRRMVLRLLLLQ